MTRSIIPQVIGIYECGDVLGVIMIIDGLLCQVKYHPLKDKTDPILEPTSESTKLHLLGWRECTSEHICARSRFNITFLISKWRVLPTELLRGY